MDLLDTELGDSDSAVEGMTQEEIENKYPIFAAMQIAVSLWQAIPDDGAYMPKNAALTAAQRAAIEFALGACAGHRAGEPHVAALESLLATDRALSNDSPDHDAPEGSIA
ncbi:hypothetical protein [Burkholderia stagnalis]|uniref:hypothetical protein n=1 Tax=Burkholderia stagnalis TaxID=1503054 RepID=UPI000F5D14E9|nr:hypothetical protein [Burkholderia stagnalis]RQY21424.1 hypothetical protein DF117_15630 [Burkholderia stagnalis]RQY98201.1 hypothetical protein DF106_13405 [Burkholderia stagnalis]RQZ04233.1 hypothetical protein DF105_18340 [Burkholderia stagnalis]